MRTYTFKNSTRILTKHTVIFQYYKEIKHTNVEAAFALEEKTLARRKATEKHMYLKKYRGKKKQKPVTRV